jgi:hypothetical protein
MVKILSDIENIAVEEFKQKVIKRFGNAEIIMLSTGTPSA